MKQSAYGWEWWLRVSFWSNENDLYLDWAVVTQVNTFVKTHWNITERPVYETMQIKKKLGLISLEQVTFLFWPLAFSSSERE